MTIFKEFEKKYKQPVIALLIVVALMGIAAAVTVSQAKAEEPAHLMDILKVANDLEAKAKAGDSASQYQLGLYYYNGMVVGQDLDKAVKWLDLAHQQGNLEASNVLGELYNLYGVDRLAIISAYRYFRAAAEGGLTEGQTNVGTMYFNGRGTKQDFSKAIKWFVKASEHSHRAKYYLGISYQLGKGFVADPIKAFTWYIMAADEGNKFAANNVAVAYDRGEGVKEDKAAAFKYFQRSAELGYVEAQFETGNRHFLGVGTKRSMEDAFVWLSFASYNGHKSAPSAASFVKKKMTLAQIKAAGARIDRMISGNFNREWI